MKLTMAAVIPALLAGGLLIPQAQVFPHVGEPCTVLHSVTSDPSGPTLWCKHTMTSDPATGEPDLVWLGGGDGD
jgi:hypothetical protein